MNLTEADIWMKGVKFTFEAEKEGVVNFMIDGNKYRLGHHNGWFMLTKNGGGYKSEFYTLGIKDRHEIADHLVEYVLGDE